MENIIETDIQQLKTLVTAFGRLKLAKAIGMPYGTLNSKLNEFFPFSVKELEKISAVLVEAGKKE